MMSAANGFVRTRSVITLLVHLDRNGSSGSNNTLGSCNTLIGIACGLISVPVL